MTSPLAKIFSTADSWKRALTDMLTNPVLHAQRSIAYGAEKLNNLSTDLYTANSKSVLIPPTQKEAARERATDSMTNFMAGFGGIIVPVRSAITDKYLASDIRQELDIDPKAAWDQYRAYVQPVSKQHVIAIEDSPAVQIKPGSIKQFTASNQRRLNTGKGGTVTTLADVVDLSRYPQDLQEFFKATKVYNRLGEGAEYTPRSNTMTFGEFKSDKDLISAIFHEMQHGAQYLYDMPFGGSQRQFYKDYGKFDTAAQVARNSLDKLTGGGPVAQSAGRSAFSQGQIPSRDALLQDPASLSDILDMLTRVSNKGFSNYENIAGEAEARLVEQYLRPSNTYLHPTEVMRNMGVDPKKLIRTEDAAQHLVDTDPVTQTLIKVLLGSPASPATGAKP